jgi:uncharacterized membrane protein YoaK (UPF0700 family)
MISKLPKWVELGGFLLAFNAGSINAVGLLGFKHESVSHLSGASTLLAKAAVHSDFANAGHLALIILCFMLGATLSSLIVGNESLRMGRHYGVALFVEALLLVGATLLLKDGSSNGHFLASAACGLQNAMATTYSGAVVRTTHVTGLVTDLGIAIGGILRGEPQVRRKIQLLGALIAGFIFGSGTGAYLFQFYNYNTLLLSAALCFLLSISYRIMGFINPLTPTDGNSDKAG